MEIRTSRESEPPERTKILEIHRQAFGAQQGEEIAQLVDDLFDDETAKPILSLVASKGATLLGHILFTRVTVSGHKENVSAQILAPLAVTPSMQGQGIGQQLIKDGLKLLQESGTELVFVLGHPAYYPKCGFIPAGRHGLFAPYQIPEEHADAWMVLDLSGKLLGKVSGTVQCSKTLNEPQHWRE